MAEMQKKLDDAGQVRPNPARFAGADPALRYSGILDRVRRSATPSPSPAKTTFAAWYQEVIAEADMAEESGVRGCMVIKPWGYGIWERIQQLMDDRIKAAGVRELLFPAVHPAVPISPRKPSTSKALPRKWRSSPITA